MEFSYIIKTVFEMFENASMFSIVGIFGNVFVYLWCVLYNKILFKCVYRIRCHFLYIWHILKICLHCFWKCPRSVSTFRPRCFFCSQPNESGIGFWRKVLFCCSMICLNAKSFPMHNYRMTRSSSTEKQPGRSHASAEDTDIAKHVS